MKKFVKAVLPKFLLKKILDYRFQRNEEQSIKDMFRDWELIKKGISAQKSSSGNKRNLFIFPGDPETIARSLGDDAMTTAIIQHYRAKNSDINIHVFCRGESAQNFVKKIGLTPVKLPEDTEIPTKILDIFKENNVDEIVVIGADVMDGYYDPKFSAAALVVSDIAARLGARATILGFSFNEAPAPSLRQFFDGLHSSVEVNLRDAVSLKRFQDFTSCRSNLVADSAFKLIPTAAPEFISDWVLAQKAAERIVLGINLHPMLIKKMPEETKRTIIKSTSSALSQISVDKNVSFLFIPHDYRVEKGDGDDIILSPIFEAIPATMRGHFQYLKGEHQASALKAIAGLMDGVLSARMHLAIAALGMGIPTMCVTYQGKFEGLFQHFDLPQDLLLNPDVFSTPEVLRSAMASFIDQIPLLKTQVLRKLPAVQEAAAQNFR